ncbi:MAG: hypothetical protein J6N55_11685 [Anaerovibrio sp.]|uniref:hypothetical protein n=1 Tax=Anaerovibrio sp. TaxID=1872532 RepID=UPI001B2D2EF3|nr:hypothetical protein [Anaerovibrio sp.]MBO6246921.1 hypothetical protein [Anaerovibrio sp.]
MASPNEFYVIQPAFTGGEISTDVASRIDLDKYQMALMQAENAIIRPYGAVKKRPGFIYCGGTKYQDKKCILVKFAYSVNVSYMLEIGHQYIRIWKNNQYLNIELSTPFTESELPNLRYVQSVDIMYITSGTHPVMKLMRYAENNWQIQEVDWQVVPFGELQPDETNYLTPSGTSGNITITASKDTFTANDVGSWISLEQRIGSSTVSISNGTSSVVAVGDTWKIICHGTWSGSVTIQISYDGGNTWLDERKYTGAGDYNPTESGTVEAYCLMRVVASTGGGLTCDFTAFSYTHYGSVKITGYTDAKHVTAIVKEKLGGTVATTDWKFSCWGPSQGYPYTVTLFQDRLCLGGNEKFPMRVWMSRTGDYENFKVKKESGNVTDDSAVSADLLCLKAYRIMHMDAGNDLLILTEGNEWSISGAETVTPSNITPRTQQNFGANNTHTIRVGNRLVYVQRRGSIVRDMEYAYATDSYGGYDLTLLAKHLIKGRELVDCTFAQEPDSVLYYVRNDGQVLCLTYIMEQKVYAWSHIVTDGIVESICSTEYGNNDIVYAVIKRTINGQTKRYIERLDIDRDSSNQQDYIMMDCAARLVYSTATATITGLNHLEGKTVLAMGDGYLFEPKTVSSGTITLEQPVNNVVVGLPYTLILEQPNFNTNINGIGNVQSMEQAVNNIVLRLNQSYGGMVGPDEDNLNNIVYDVNTMDLGEPRLFTGDKKIVMASGGFNKYGRTYIKHDSPYPFTVSAIIRAVTMGGPGL